MTIFRPFMDARKGKIALKATGPLRVPATGLRGMVRAVTAKLRDPNRLSLKPAESCRRGVVPDEEPVR